MAFNWRYLLADFFNDSNESFSHEIHSLLAQLEAFHAAMSALRLYCRRLRAVITHLAITDDTCCRHCTALRTGRSRCLCFCALRWWCWQLWLCHRQHVLDFAGQCSQIVFDPVYFGVVGGRLEKFASAFLMSYNHIFVRLAWLYFLRCNVRTRIGTCKQCY